MQLIRSSRALRYRSAIPAISLLCLVLTGCPSPGPGGPTAQKSLSERFAVDGTASLASIGTVHAAEIALRDNFGYGASAGKSALDWAICNDDRELFLVIEWDDPAQHVSDPSKAMDDFDGIALVFDSGGTGSLADKADARRLLMTDYGSTYGDLHLSGSDMADDAVGDGMGKLIYLQDSKKYHAEFLIPLSPDSAGEDGSLSAASRFEIVIYENIQLTLATPTGTMGCLSGGAPPAVNTNTSSWPKLPLAAGGTYDQPSLPAGLTGLIAFISDQESANGGIYTFDPATGALKEVVSEVKLGDGTGLYIDGLSLSHDKTKVAFYGSDNRTDYAKYEIYTMGIDGNGLKAITSNSILDGHPAWSPDDSKLAYASFRSGGAASLVVCDALDGGNERVLTPSGDNDNDNDPDWLPDGRIVFKTDRFGKTGSSQVRIALMDADGTKVLQLTDTAGCSDHDPTGTDSAVLFERFMSATDYSTDPAAEFKPWDIVETRTDGTGERSLKADGWINWLPVRDPSGGYIAYLKSVGYTDARLMDAEGRDLGRLIPDQTKIRYLDWK